MKTEDENQSENCDFNIELLDKVLSCLSVRLKLNNDRQIKQLRIFSIPIALCSFIIMDFLALFGQYFYIRDSIKKNNMFLVVQVISHFLSTIIDLAKGCQLFLITAELEAVLRDLSNLWRQYTINHDMHETILHKANKTIKFCKVFIVVTVGSAFTFGAPPFLNLCKEYFNRKNENYTHNYEQGVFIFKYPFQVNSFVRYLSVVTYEEYLLVGAALIWVISDVIFAFLTTHVSLQLEILQYDMKSLIDSDADGYFLKQRFNHIIRRHMEILRICAEIENMFSPLIFIAVLVSGTNICFNVFGTNNAAANGRYADATSHFSLLLITFFQIIFYCTFAEILTEKTRTFADAAYRSNWTKKSNVVRVYMQMIIMKSQKPFYCTGYGFFPIGQTTLLSILNAAYTYYMMLQASTE